MAPVSREIVARSRWGYQQWRPISKAPVQRTGLSLHYGAGPEWLGHNAPRGLQSVHFGRGFAALGYPFVAELDGLLFYGRPLDLRGAHTYGHNTTWHAVCVPANEGTHPTDELVDALAWLLRHGVTRGWWEGLVFAPHYELSPTECPGPLDAIAGEVVRLAKRKHPSSTPQLDEDEQMIKFEDGGKIKVFYPASGRVKHLATNEAYQAVNALQEKFPDLVRSAGEVPGLSKAGFED